VEGQCGGIRNWPASIVCNFTLPYGEGLVTLGAGDFNV
jgi:hypothetical protein